MGADFKEKAKRSFEKSWDNAAVAANTPDLFRKLADAAPVRFEAELICDACAVIGEYFYAQVENGKIICRRGISPVLVIASPTSTLLQVITEACNIARVEVVAVDPVSGVLEVTVH